MANNKKQIKSPKASQNSKKTASSTSKREILEPQVLDADDIDDEEEEKEDYNDDAIEVSLSKKDFLDDPTDEDVEGADDSITALALIEPNSPVQSRDSLHAYLYEVNKFPLLQPEEELELANLVKKTGDPNAAFRLISSHLRLVVRIAMGFQRRWMQNVLDLIQEGNIGLVKAVNKFDPDKGIKFSYYASFWIRAYILKFIMDNWRLVKLGTTQAQRKLFYNLNKERQALIMQGYEPDDATLAERFNVSEDEIIEMRQRLEASDMSLNAPLGEDEGDSGTRMDYLPALEAGIEDVLNNSQVSALVHERLTSLMPKLSDKEQYILQHRILTDDPLTLREIGEHFDITRERIRQIEARLLQKIRDHLVHNIKDFSREWIEQ